MCAPNVIEGRWNGVGPGSEAGIIYVVKPQEEGVGGVMSAGICGGCKQTRSGKK